MLLKISLFPSLFIFGFVPHFPEMSSPSPPTFILCLTLPDSASQKSGNNKSVHGIQGRGWEMNGNSKIFVTEQGVRKVLEQSLSEGKNNEVGKCMGSRARVLGSYVLLYYLLSV